MEQIIRRKLMEELWSHLVSGRKEIALITGARQAGKTTLMRRLGDELHKKGERTCFLNLDYESDRPFFESQESLLKKLELELGSHGGFVFIDEIQRKENAGLFLKGLYDRGLPYRWIVSGSGSLELKERIHESLTGRKRQFELGPVSFEEWIDFKTDYRYSNRLDNFFAVEKKRTAEWLDEYLNFGGYPRVVLEQERAEKQRAMDEIFRSYVEKDIGYLLGVKKPEVFSQMIKILATQAGTLLQYSRLAAETGISMPTLKQYLWYAEKTFIIKTLPPYFRNRRKEIVKSPIPYFYDLGLRSFASGTFGQLQNLNEKSFAFQNFIANILQEKLRFTSQTLGFWRTLDRAEVDFVIRQGLEVLPIEVKFSDLKKPEVTRSLRSFIEKYNPRQAYVVNLNLKTFFKINKTTIKFIPFHFLLTQKSLFT